MCLALSAYIVLWDSPLLFYCLAVCLFFLSSEYIIWCGYTIGWLFFILLLGIWLVSNIWLIWIKLLWTLFYNILYGYIFIPFGWKTKSWITELYGKCIFNFVRNFWAVLQSTWQVYAFPLARYGVTWILTRLVLSEIFICHSTGFEVDCTVVFNMHLPSD